MSNEETALVKQSERTAMQVEKDAESGIEQAKALCGVLTKFVNDAKLARHLGGDKPHLEVEAWQFIGQHQGVYPHVESTEYIVDPNGKIVGARAKVTLRREGDDSICGQAISECHRDEPNWARKPMFQLVSMAQTRAIGKVLRLRFGWIVRVNNEYSATPAEEMTVDEHRNGSTAAKCSVYLTGYTKECNQQLKDLGCKTKKVQVDGKDEWRRYVPFEAFEAVKPVAAKYNLEWHGLPQDIADEMSATEPPSNDTDPGPGPSPNSMTPEELAAEWQKMLDSWELDSVAHAKFMEYVDVCVNEKWPLERVQAAAIAEQERFRSQFGVWWENQEDNQDVTF